MKYYGCNDIDMKIKTGVMLSALNNSDIKNADADNMHKTVAYCLFHQELKNTAEKGYDYRFGDYEIEIENGIIIKAYHWGMRSESCYYKDREECKNNWFMIAWALDSFMSNKKLFLDIVKQLKRESEGYCIAQGIIKVNDLEEIAIKNGCELLSDYDYNELCEEFYSITGDETFMKKTKVKQKKFYV